MGEHLGTPGAAGIGINDTLKGMDSVQSESPHKYAFIYAVVELYLFN